jgi:endonuclease/exonuclease/phosphatase family metal-dependent hydrolase
MRQPLVLAGTLLLGCTAAPTGPASVRVATFNIWELSTDKLTALDSTGAFASEQARAAAALIQELRPDILLLNEIDLDGDRPGMPTLNARRFADQFLAVGPDSIRYPYAYAAPSNTGLLSGFDLNRDGVIATAAEMGTRAHGDDSWGFGTYPGQYAMAILSRYPIDSAAARTFQHFTWRELPGHHIPPGWYPDSVLARFPLSSKSHWDVPVIVGPDTLHLLASHPTPPVFDGDEDRNGRRNHDEVAFWARYLDDEATIRDDAGRTGGLRAGAAFVILGDLNAPPDADGPRYGPGGAPAIAQLLSHPRIQDPPPIAGRPTASFGETPTRADYVLPSVRLTVRDGGVVWPAADADSAAARQAAAASDHRMVWLDLALPLGRSP